MATSMPVYQYICVYVAAKACNLMPVFFCVCVSFIWACIYSLWGWRGLGLSIAYAGMILTLNFIQFDFNGLDLSSSLQGVICRATIQSIHAMLAVHGVVYA